VAFRREGAWGNEATGLNLNTTLDYHAAWADPSGGIWAVGGNIVGDPRTDGILAYFGTGEVGSEVIVPDEPVGPADPTVEFGFTDADTLSFVPVLEGETMPLFSSGQGGSHIFVTLRVTGFPVAPQGITEILIDEKITREFDQFVLHDFEQVVSFTPSPDGPLEVQSRFVFLDSIPREVDGQSVFVEFTLTSTMDDSVSVNVSRSIIVDRP
jgi:hypothetical protein